VSAAGLANLPATYRICAFAVRLLLRLFFRRVEVAGRDNVPLDRGGIFIAWHPNALIDGALILSRFPRHITIGVRHGLLRAPLVGFLLRSFGAVPVYRRRDFPDRATDEERREANEKSLDRIAAAVAAGNFALLFPEGQSHDRPHPTELKTGAARLYYRSCAHLSPGAARPSILPVGLHYDSKHLFGSSALVVFHPPLELPPCLADPPSLAASEEREHAQARALTEELETALHEVVHATESWELHHTMHRARKLLRAERAHRQQLSLERPEMSERVAVFSRLWAGYNERAKTHPQELRELVKRIQSYDADLRALGIEDHELYAEAFSARRVLSLALQALLVYFVLPPLLVIGYVVNFPAVALVWLVSRWGAKAQKDLASLKLVLGAIAFPTLWLAAAVLVGWGQTRLSALYPQIRDAPILTGVVAFVMSALGALLAFHYQRLALQTLRALRVRFTRWRRSATLERLRAERADLYEDLRRLSTAA
jgi:1-acyl-sn-glycerol-3-phosphate acyltransferase